MSLRNVGNPMSKPPVAAYRIFHRYRVRVGEIKKNSEKESEVDRKKGKERNGEEKKVRW